MSILSKSFLFLTAVSFPASSAFAAIIVSYEGNSIPKGGTGYIDVMVSSDAAQATPDVLDSFSAHFLINPLGGAVSNGLQFDTQTDSQLALGTYVFSGNSLTPPPIGMVSTAINDNDSYIGGDATFNAVPVVLDNTQLPFLLFRFDLSAALANIGDQFTIQLQPGGNTEFLSDALDNDSDLNLTASSFTPFTITAVPEPTSTGLLLVGSAIGLLLKRRHRRASRMNDQMPSKQ